MDLTYFKKNSKNKRKENNLFFKLLKKIPPKVLDKIIHPIHDYVFKKTNCLECANCCKTTSPIFSDKDIIRIAKHLNLRPSEFTEKYLKIDDEQDYVLNSLPCSFLAKDNYCSIYNVRPRACKEFPHTSRKKQYQLLNLTKKNLEVCPAAYNIIEEVKNSLDKNLR